MQPFGAAGLTEADLSHSRMRHLQITASRLATAIFAGEYRSAFRGRGIEFDQVREYQPGDEVRSIDWNVTARLGSPFVKTFIEERELTVVMVLDRSPSMRFGTVRSTKLETAAEACALLSFAALRSHDRTGLLSSAAGAMDYLPPGKGKRHTLRLLQQAAQAPVSEGERHLPSQSPLTLPSRPPLCEGGTGGISPTGGETAQSLETSVKSKLGTEGDRHLRSQSPVILPSRPPLCEGGTGGISPHGGAAAQSIEKDHLDQALAYLDRVLKGRCVVCIVSDFLDPVPFCTLASLAVRHDVIALAVSDPAERELPNAGLLMLRDMETGAVAQVDTGDRLVRAAFAKQAEQRREERRREIYRSGADFLPLGTEVSPVHQLTAFFKARRRRH